MKRTTIFFSGIFCLAICAKTQTLRLPAVVRTENHKLAIETVELEDLTSEGELAGAHFIIVAGKSDSIVSVNSPEALLLKGATVYWHLTKARQYFVENLSSEYVKNLPPIAVRLDITNKYDQYGLFANDNLEPQYNNALTIPPGKGMPHLGVAPWQCEIWFRPSKNIHLDDIPQVAEGQASLQAELSDKKKKIHKTNLKKTFSTLQAGDESISMTLLKAILSAGIIEGIDRSLPVFNRAISPKEFYMETALIPEVIYHEYCHVALSEFMATTHSKAVIEGFADYFATRINDHPCIGKKTGKYSNYTGKDADNDRKYETKLETPHCSNFDFVLAMLWDVKECFGEETADRLILAAARRLDSSASIREDLTSALLDACREISPDWRSDQLKLYRLFDQRGL